MPGFGATLMQHDSPYSVELFYGGQVYILNQNVEEALDMGDSSGTSSQVMCGGHRIDV